MLYPSAGSAAAVRLPAAPRLRHRRLLLAPLATVGVLAAAVLPSLVSGVARVGVPAAGHGVLTVFSPGTHLAGLVSLPAAARAPISAALGRDLVELTPSDGVGSLRHIDGDGGESGGGPSQASDELGWSVAVSGATIVAGAPRHNGGSQTSDFGAAYVFRSGPAS